MNLSAPHRLQPDTGRALDDKLSIGAVHQRLRRRLLTRHCPLLGLLLIIPGAAVTAFNLVIDPYDRFGIVEIEGINTEKPMVFKHLRMTKTLVVARIRPRGIIIGTSRAQRIDPDHPAWSPDARPVYNLAMPALRPYETLRYLQHAQAVEPLKQVVYALDFTHFDAKWRHMEDFVEDRLRANRAGDRQRWKAIRFYAEEAFAAVLSFDAVRDSIETLRYNTNDEGPARLHGGSVAAATSRHWALQALQRFQQRPAQVIAAAEQVIARQCRPDVGGYFSRFILSTPSGYSSLEPFGRIVAFARAHKIDLRLFIEPIHALYREAIATGGKWALYEEWKRRIVGVLATDHARYPDRPAFPLWDFSGYTRITTEPVHPDRKKPALMRWHENLSHYSRETGRKILNIVLGSTDTPPGEDNDLVIRLTPKSLEPTLARIRAERREFLARTPWIATLTKLDQAIQNCAPEAEIRSAMKRFSLHSW